MWNGHSGADTWCPVMEPMSQIMFYNHLATFATIVKSAKGPQVGRFHNGMGPDVERHSGADTLCPAREPMSQIMFYNHLATFATIFKSAKGPQVGRFHNGMGPDVERHSGADTWCPAMEPMSQIMFYNHLATFATIVKSAKGPQVGRFHNGMGPDVERAQWCGHLVSGHGTNVSNHVL